MNAHVPAMSIWLILAVICWFIAAFFGSFAGYAPAPAAGTPYRWGVFGGFGWLGLFFYGLFLIFGRS
jgi:hypothetical protein